MERLVPVLSFSDPCRKFTLRRLYPAAVFPRRHADELVEGAGKIIAVLEA